MTDGNIFNPRPDVIVRIDDRVRLMSALLATTRYPEMAQTSHPHGTHAHARATRKGLSGLAGHEAVSALQALLDQGTPLEALFTLALALNPVDYTLQHTPRWSSPQFPEWLRDFAARARLADGWAEEAEIWTKSLEDVRRVFAAIALKPFLTPFLGEIRETFLFMPNLLYPTDHELALRLNPPSGSDTVGTLVAIIPPRLAWGDSPPWGYDEDPAYLVRAAIANYGRSLMLSYLRAHPEKIAEAATTPLPVSDALRTRYPTWQEQFTQLFIAGAVAIYLEDHLSKREADAYIVMERKARGMTALPAVVSVMRHYRSEKAAGSDDEAGETGETLGDFIILFPKQLRIANRIVSM